MVKKVTYNGVEMSISECAREIGMESTNFHKQLNRRLNAGMSEQEAVDAIVEKMKKPKPVRSQESELKYIPEGDRFYYENIEWFKFFNLGKPKPMRA